MASPAKHRAKKQLTKQNRPLRRWPIRSKVDAKQSSTEETVFLKEKISLKQIFITTKIILDGNRNILGTKILASFWKKRVKKNEVK